MFVFFTLLEITIIMGAPIAVGLWVRRRSAVSWSSFFVGAATFVGSQIVHLPLVNRYLVDPFVVPDGPLHPLFLQALAYALTAGLCEELARYLVFRFFRKRDRSGPHALMLGAGHGGVEAFIVGAAVVQALLSYAYIRQIGLERLGLDPSLTAWIGSQMDAAEQAPWAGLPVALERLCSITFHLSASCLVMVAVVRRQPLWLLAAIGWHTLGDWGVVYFPRGQLAVLVWIVGTVPVSIAILRYALRRLPDFPHPSPGPRPEAKGEPIELHDCEKRFGEVRALQGVSLTLRRGERACLLGPNGAGKTTAIRLLTGALAPSRGWAFVFGRTSSDPDFLAAKRRVGIVPQQPGMYDKMTVRAYLDLVRELYGAPPYGEVAARLGLSELLDRETKALSGGMQRRLCLCGALLSSPELLILDEPSAGLDPVAQREMTKLLRSAAEDRTTLLCTHDLDEAEELCETVIILRGGKVLVHAPIAELRAAAPARLAVRAAQGTERVAEVLARQGHQPSVEDGEVSIAAPGGERAVPDILRRLLEDGIDVFECRVIRPTLEDLFLTLVSRESDPGEERPS